MEDTKGKISLYKVVSVETKSELFNLLRSSMPEDTNFVSSILYRVYTKVFKLKKIKNCNQELKKDVCMMH